MPFLILIVLLTIPYLEFLVFLKVGNAIGGLYALSLTILSAFIGIYLIRKQGLVIIGRMHEALQKGESPVEDMLGGFFLLIAGLFFLLPGFITDSIALLLIIPPFRAFLGRHILNNIQASFYKQHHNKDHDNSHQSGIIIEGEYQETSNNNKIIAPPKNTPPHDS